MKRRKRVKTKPSTTVLVVEPEPGTAETPTPKTKKTRSKSEYVVNANFDGTVVWDRYIHENFAAMGGPWRVGDETVAGQYGIWTSQNTLVCTTANHAVAKAIASLPQMHCAALGANRVIETASELEIRMLDEARTGLYALKSELTQDP